MRPAARAELLLVVRPLRRPSPVACRGRTAVSAKPGLARGPVIDGAPTGYRESGDSA